VLLALSTAGLEGHLLTLSAPTGTSGAGGGGAAVDRYGGLFTAEPIARLLDGTSSRDVFLTTHFNQPPAPTTTPAPPKSRNVALTYLGLLGDGNEAETSVLVRVDATVKQFSVGGAVLEDWRVAGIGRDSLVITNQTGTNSLAFGQTIQLSVPLP
jgi:hypothetical protein